MNSELRNDRLQAMIVHAESAFKDLTIEDWLQQVSSDWRSPHRAVRVFQVWGSRLSLPVSVGTTHWDGDRSVTELIDAKQRAWEFVVATDPESPFRVASMALGIKSPEGYVVREATPDDAQAWELIEAGSPIEVRGGSKIIDRSGEILARFQMMDEVFTQIAFVDNKPAACWMASRRTATFSGREVRLGYSGHLRILPEYQGHKLRTLLNSKIAEKMTPRVDAVYGIADPENERIMREVAKLPTRPVWRAILNCAVIDGKVSSGQTVGEAELGEIAQLINLSHQNDLLWSPYSEKPLRERLHRVPSRYGLDRIWRSEHAIIGMWRGSERWSFSDGTDARTRGQVLDYAVLPGHEDEFENLLLAAVHQAKLEGIDELSIMGCDRICGEGPIKSLAADVENYECFITGLDITDTTCPIWIDQAYL